MPRRETIADQLRDAINEDPGTYYKLAKNAGVSIQSLTRFVDGDRDLYIETASRVCAVLGLELRSIEKGDE